MVWLFEQKVLAVPWKLPATVKWQRRLVGCSIGEERQRRRHGRRLFLIYCDVFAYCCSFIFFLNWVDVILFYFSISFFLLVIVTVKNVIINIVAIAILRRREHLWDGNAWRLMLRLREQVCRHCERHAALALNLFRRLASSAQWLQRIATLQITSNLCGWWCGDSSSTMTCHTRRLAKMSYTPAVRTHDTRSSRALPVLHSLAFKNNAMQLVVKTSMKINLYW